MDSNFRKLTLRKIAENSGILSSSTDGDEANVPISTNITADSSNVNGKNNKIKEAGRLTDFVKKELGGEQKNKDLDIESRFLKFKPGQERDDWIFNEIIKKGKPKTVPITMNGPGGIKITIKVMTDSFKIGNFRPPMSGQLAQRIVDHFNMRLPTPKIVDRRWEVADVKIRPVPFSSSGVTLNGRHYTAQQVVDNMIPDPRLAVEYNKSINKKIEESGKTGLIAGYGKNIIAPEGDPNKLGYYGWGGQKGDILEPSVQTGHGIKDHHEYAAHGEGVDNEDVVVTMPDGRKISTTLDAISDHPTLYKVISNTPGIKKYNLD